MRSCLLLCVTMWITGCASPRQDIAAPFTQEQTRALTKQARPPSVFGVTVYSSDSGPVFAGAHRVHAGDLAQMPFKSGNPNNPAPIIVMKPGGPGDYLALIDTSARDSWLSPIAAAKANMVPLGSPALFEKKPEHVFDETSGYLCAVPKIRLDELHIETGLMYVRAAIGPLGPLSRWEDNPPPEAVMGMNILRAFSFVQFDFKRHIVKFSSSSEFHPDETSLIASLPLREINGALAAEGAVDGEPALIILDTGGDFELSRKEAPDAKTRQVSVGDLVFRQVATQSSYERGLGMPDHPRIGRQLLSRFRVTLDFRNKLIHVERP